MALIEKVTRKIEIDENNGSHIHVRKTTHIIDDVTGENKGSTNHRMVVDVDDDAKAAQEGLTEIANIVWTPEVRAAEQSRKADEQARIDAEAATHVPSEAVIPTPQQ